MKILQTLKENYILTAILVVGIILRIYHIDFQSVWLDEIHTLNDANPSNSISEVYASIMVADPHPPLYFYCIHILFKIFGYKAIIARLFSAIIGVAAIYAIYKLGKELINKEVGIIAALLLTVNGFHIYYSQDARPYTMLCLVTIVSFFYLVRFIKIPSRKNAVFYGLGASLMLYGHFFALFGLLSQLAILAFFFIISKKTNKKAFFINCLIAGLIMIILFLPAVKIFIAATNIKEFWIPMPTPDVYTLIFKEFFGNSEMIIALTSFILLLYIIRISKEPSIPINYSSVIENKTVLSFIILITWIVVVLLVPLIRSYISIPMIISRYFINLLPAIIIIIAIGIYQFKNQVFKYSIIALFFLFTFVDLIVVKKYYTTVNKTQFREITQFIADHNKNNEPVVTSLPWYFPYFLNNEKYHYTIVDKTLDSYVQEMAQDTTKKRPFWYVDAHNRPFKVTEQTQKYLDDNFIVEDNQDLYDTWTKHFSISTNGPRKIDISKYAPLKDRNGATINYSIENYNATSEAIQLSGWSYFAEQEALNSKIDIIYIKDGTGYTLSTQRIKRTDVTSYFKSSYNIDDSGFESKIILKKLPKGKYTIGILIRDNKLNKEGLIVTDKFFEN